MHEIYVEYNNDDRPDIFDNVVDFRFSNTGVLAIAQKGGTITYIPPHGMKRARVYTQDD